MRKRVQASARRAFFDDLLRVAAGEAMIVSLCDRCAPRE